MSESTYSVLHVYTTESPQSSALLVTTTSGIPALYEMNVELKLPATVSERIAGNWGITVPGSTVLSNNSLAERIVDRNALTVAAYPALDTSRMYLFLISETIGVYTTKLAMARPRRVRDDTTVITEYVDMIFPPRYFVKTELCLTA